MKLFSFAFALLLATAAAVSTGHKFNGPNMQQQLLEVKSANPELYNTIQAMIEAGDPVDDIISLLNELRNNIEAEESTAHAQQQQKQADCEAEESRHQSDISRIKGAINQAEADVNQLNGEIESTRGQHEENERLLQENDDSQSRARSSREAEEEEYRKSSSDHQDAIDAIDQVLRLLDESTLTDIQLLEEIPSLLEKIKPHAKSTAMHTKVALLQSLVKSSSGLRGDQQPAERKDKVDRVIRLLNELREQFVNSLRVLEENEKKNQNSFDKVIEALKNEEDALRDTNRDLDSTVNRLSSEVAEKQNEISNLEAEVEVIENEILPAVVADCESHVNQFNDGSSRRSEEIDVIDQCIEILGGRVQPRLPGICENCGENAHCENELCVCDEGYKGNGFDCVRVDPIPQLATATLSSSSVWGNSKSYSEPCANFNRPSFCSGPWYAGTQKAGEWFQVDMHEVKHVAKIKIAGTGPSSSRTTSLNILYGNEEGDWHDFGVFNSENGEYNIEAEFDARYVRIVALKWVSYITLKVEVYTF